jgi:hypothetical protein
MTVRDMAGDYRASTIAAAIAIGLARVLGSQRKFASGVRWSAGHPANVLSVTRRLRRRDGMRSSAPVGVGKSLIGGGRQCYVSEMRNATTYFKSVTLLGMNRHFLDSTLGLTP